MQFFGTLFKQTFNLPIPSPPHSAAILDSKLLVGKIGPGKLLPDITFILSLKSAIKKFAHENHFEKKKNYATQKMKVFSCKVQFFCIFLHTVSFLLKFHFSLCPGLALCAPPAQILARYYFSLWTMHVLYF